MRVRWKIALASAALLAAAVAFWPREETFVQGRPVGEWALELLGPVYIEPAQKVFLSAGPEVIPDLARLLETRDALWKRPLLAVERKLPLRWKARFRRVTNLREWPRERVAAAQALGLMGTNAVPALPVLSAALRDPDQSVKHAAARALAKIGPASVPPMMEAFDDTNRCPRSVIYAGLMELGPDAAGALPRLVPLLENPREAPMARETLARIGQPALPGLIESLQTEAARENALVALGRMGGLARRSIPAIQPFATNSSWRTRLEAVTALGRICVSCSPVPGVLEQALSDESLPVRKAAAAQLSRDPALLDNVLGKLMVSLEQGSEAEIEAAVLKLGLFGNAAGRARPALEALAETNFSLRTLAQASLAQINATNTPGRPPGF